MNGLRWPIGSNFHPFLVFQWATILSVTPWRCTRITGVFVVVDQSRRNGESFVPLFCLVLLHTDDSTFHYAVVCTTAVLSVDGLRWPMG